MADTKKPAKLSDEKVETLRQQLADHDRLVEEERKQELVGRYKDVHTFLSSKEVGKVVEEADKLASTLASASEDRNLYFSLTNVKVAFDALQTTLDQRARAEGLTFEA
jgi:hypothetical protein